MYSIKSETKDNFYHIIICGGHTELNYEIIETFILDVFKKLNIVDCEVVSGNRKGIDRLGEDFAFNNHFRTKIFPANWKAYGKSAGPIRNKEMVKYISKFNNSIVIAFWNGESKGTKYTIDEAKKYNIPVYVYNYSKT